MRTYTVQKNDTLWSIAKAELHSTARYAEIVQANHLKTATLVPGQALRLPKEGADHEHE